VVSFLREARYDPVLSYDDCDGGYSIIQKVCDHRAAKTGV